MTRLAALAALAVLLLASTPALAEDPAMHMAAERFYGVYKGFHPSDGIPDAAGRAKYQPFLSDRLVTLLDQAGRAEAAFSAKNKGAPPLIEGDIFTSLFEGASTVSVGTCGGDAQHGQCAVALSYAAPREKPVSWTDTVYLVSTPGGWRVDDIAYGGNWDFGNKGRLSQTLGEVLRFQ
jgi:hypothetical protein